MAEFKRRPTPLAKRLRNNATDAERHLWRHISRRQLDGHKFSRQMPIGPFICDFLCREARLVIEVDGGQHDARQPSDRRRTERIESEGYRVLRFWNNDVLENIDGVLIRIAKALEPQETLPLPLVQAEGA